MFQVRAVVVAWSFVWFLPTVGRELAAAETSHVYKRFEGRELHVHVVEPDRAKFAGPRPAIVFFHGGGWSGGSPAQFNALGDYLATRGMVVAKVEYRLLKGRKEQHPTVCCQDAKSAMRWVRANAEKLGIDANRIAAGGGSAGGHLAAFVGMVAGIDDPADDLKVSPKPAALVLFNPVYDNGPDGWGHARVGDRYREFSPFHNVSADDPPTLVICGSKDALVPVKTLEAFQAAMQKAGVRCENRIYDGRAHSFFNYKDGKNADYYATAIDTDKFLASLGWLEGPPSLKVPELPK